MADFRSVKRMRAGKVLRDKRKEDSLKNIEENIKKEPKKEDIQHLIDIWKKSKENAKKQ